MKVYELIATVVRHDWEWDYFYEAVYGEGVLYVSEGAAQRVATERNEANAALAREKAKTPAKMDEESAAMTDMRVKFILTGEGPFREDKDDNSTWPLVHGDSSRVAHIAHYTVQPREVLEDTNEEDRI